MTTASPDSAMEQCVEDMKVLSVTTCVHAGARPMVTVGLLSGRWRQFSGAIDSSVPHTVSAASSSSSYGGQRVRRLAVSHLQRGVQLGHGRSAKSQKRSAHVSTFSNRRGLDVDGVAPRLGESMGRHSLASCMQIATMAPHVPPPRLLDPATLLFVADQMYNIIAFPSAHSPQSQRRCA